MMRIILFKRIKLKLCGFVILFLFSLPAAAQPGPPFPRIGVFHWGGAQPEWYAQFGLVISWNNSAKFARSIHEINPNCLVLPTRDWNVGSGMSIPDEWIVRDSQGKKVNMYGGSQPMVDITDYCPRSIAQKGKKYNEFLPEFMSNLADLSIYDGVATDGVYRYPREQKKNVDLNRNKVNDWDEHGKEWITSKWTKGVEKVVSDLRNRIGTDKIIHLNSGGFHTFAWQKSNGLTMEHCNVTFTVEYALKKFLDWKQSAPYPHTILVDGKGKNKNDFYQMRYFLGQALMFDAYYSYSDEASGEHRYDKYYDEFDLDLGYPKDEIQQVTVGNGGIAEQGIWVKFYDNGMVIINLDHKNNSITDVQLRKFKGYDGPYYRFRGGQVPEFNNGEQFTEITLSGKQVAWKPLGFVGDAIILLKEPKIVVADIIIDNVDAGTSPASEAAKFGGWWAQEEDKDSVFWGVGGRAYCGLFNYAHTQPQGSGVKERQAKYVPTIGIAGNYEVFEWHGFLGDSKNAVQEATKVPVIIEFAGNQVAEGYIDQSRNYKKWNSLGTYYFAKGTKGSVTITNDADGEVMADAFKFVYKGADSHDTVSPHPPENLQMADNTEHTITLKWEVPKATSDGDGATAYQVFRNGKLVGRPLEVTFTDQGLSANTRYTYEVYSVNNIGNRSVTSIQGEFKTASDKTAPQIISARLLASNKLRIGFSEKVDQASAGNPLNYKIDPEIAVHDVQINPADSTVYYLATSEHDVGTHYSLYAQNIRDRDPHPNIIDPKSKVSYVGITSDSLRITITADDAYDLYVNGCHIASSDGWSTAEIYEVPTIGGANIVAVKGIDKDGEAGLLAEIEFNNDLFFTNENWKVTTSEESNWEKLNFDDTLWSKATSYGLHGSAEPWAKYKDVKGITAKSVHWIWSSDYVNDNIAFFRYELNKDKNEEKDRDKDKDITPPSPPSNLIFETSY